jgi:hypothetical protein
LLEARLCFSCNYWLKLVDVKDDPRTVRIDGGHYIILPDGDGPVGGLFQGFGGRRFTIEFFDGRQAVTNNLWNQGDIPEHFRVRLPDNARFIRD